MPTKSSEQRVDEFAVHVKKFVRNKPLLWGALALVGLVLFAVGRTAFDSFAASRVGEPVNRAFGGAWHELTSETIGRVGAAIIVLTILAMLWNATVKPLWAAHKARRPGNDLETARKQLESARTLNEAFKIEIRDLNWRWQFDEPPPEVELLEEVDCREAATELSRYKGALIDISHTLGAVLNDFMLCLHYDQGGGTHDLFWRYQKTPMLWILGLATEPKNEDRRVVFRAFLRRYKDFKKTLREATTVQGRDLSAFPSYADWHAADAAFSDSLGKLADIEGTKGVRQFVRDIDARTPMPRPATSWEASGVEYVKMVNAWSPKIHPAPGPFPERRAG